MTLHSLHQKKPTGTMAWNNGMTLSSELLAMEEKPHSGMTAIIILPPNLYHFTALPTSDWPGDRLEYQLYRRMKKGASKEVKWKSTRDLKLGLPDHGLCLPHPSRLHTCSSTVLLMHKKAKLTVRKKSQIWFSHWNILKIDLSHCNRSWLWSGLCYNFSTGIISFRSSGAV